MPVRFVGELSPDLSKVAIGDRLCQLVVFEHARHAQIFYRYHRVVFAEIAGELMRGIFADSSEYNTGFSNVDKGKEMPSLDEILDYLGIPPEAKIWESEQ